MQSDTCSRDILTTGISLQSLTADLKKIYRVATVVEVEELKRVLSKR